MPRCIAMPRMQWMPMHEISANFGFRIFTGTHCAWYIESIDVLYKVCRTRIDLLYPPICARSINRRVEIISTRDMYLISLSRPSNRFGRFHNCESKIFSLKMWSSGGRRANGKTWSHFFSHDFVTASSNRVIFNPQPYTEQTNSDSRDWNAQFRTRWYRMRVVNEKRTTRRFLLFIFILFIWRYTHTHTHTPIQPLIRSLWNRGYNIIRLRQECDHAAIVKSK